MGVRIKRERERERKDTKAWEEEKNESAFALKENIFWWVKFQKWRKLFKQEPQNNLILMWRHKCFYTATDSLLSLKPQTSVYVIRLRISLEVPTNSKIRHSYLAWKTKGTTVRRYNWIVSVWKHFPNTFIQTHTALFKWIHPTAPECFLSSPPFFFFLLKWIKCGSRHRKCNQWSVRTIRGGD